MPVSAGTAYLDVAPRIHRTFSRDLQTQMVRPMGRAADDGGKQAGQQFSKRLADAGDRAGIEGGRRFSKRFGVSMRTGLGPVRGLASGLGGQLAAAFGGVAIAAGLKSVIDEAREAAKVGRQTAAVLKATGGVARVSARDVDQLADSLSRKVGVDDEIIASGANMLLTFKGVRNEVGRNNDIFNQASSVILDMTAAMHQGEISQQGLEKATIQVGKALNDPIRGITALTRVGVTFDEGQKKQIKTLVESGRKMEAQKIILGELRSEFGGAAKAAADPWQRLGVALDNVKERIGTSLLPAFSAGASMLTDQVLPAVDRLWRQFQADLRPELGRVRIAWDDNKGAILGFVGSLTGSQSGMDSSADAARGLADALEQLIQKSGQAAEVGDRVGDWLNRQNAELQDSGHRINEGLVEPWARATQRFGEFFGLRPLPQLQGLADRMTGVHEETDKAAVATDKAATAADRHATALRGEKQALEDLQGALDDEKTAEIDLRQAKLNVSTAQKRVNDLKADGKTKSFEYKQAQLDLERAQIALRHKTDDYKVAQGKANAAAGGAMRASQAAAGAHRELARDAGRAGSAAWLMGGKIKDGLLRIPKGRIIKVTATFGFKTPPGVSMHDIVGATGGYVTGSAIVPRRLHRGGLLSGPGTETSDSIPARLSRGEYVVNARAVRKVGRDTLDDINAQGFARGGLALDASFASTSRLTGSFTRFLSVIDRSMTKLAGKWDRFAERFMGRPGIQQFIRSTDPLPYIWGGAGPGGYDCSGLVGAVYGKHTGRGGGRGQRYFTTASISARGGLKPGLGGVLNIGVTPGQGHMSGSYAGLGFEARSTRSGIIIGPGARSPSSFARHFHMARGGAVDERMIAALALLGADIGGDAGRLRIDGKVLDNGGFLMPGRTLAINRTGRPEVVMPLGKLSAVFGDNLRSWVVPWLRRIAVGVERGGRPVAGFSGGNRPASAIRRAFKPLTAQQLNRLPDAARWAYVDAHGRPKPPAGFAWAEDHSLVPTSFWNKTSYDQGGWLMPGATLAVNRTGRPEPVGIDEDRLARKIAAELAKVIPTTVAVTDIQTGLLRRDRQLGVR